MLRFISKETNNGYSVISQNLEQRSYFLGKKILIVVKSRRIIVFNSIRHNILIPKLSHWMFFNLKNRLFIG